MRKLLSKVVVGLVVLAAAYQAEAANTAGLFFSTISNSVSIIASNTLGNAGTPTYMLGTVDGGGGSTNGWGYLFTGASINSGVWQTQTVYGLQYGGNYYINLVIADATGTTNDWFSTGVSSNFTAGLFVPTAPLQPVTQWPSLPAAFTNQSGVQQTNATVIASLLSNSVNLLTGILTNLYKFPQH